MHSAALHQVKEGADATGFKTKEFGAKGLLA